MRFEHQRQLGARDGAVHAVVVRRDAADRGERGLAPGPEQHALVLGIRDPQRGRAAALGDLGDALDQMIDLGRRPVELDDQQRLDVERIAGVDELLGRVDRGLVHHLHAARDDARADDARDAFAGVLRAREADQHRARGLRLLQQPHGHLGDDAEQSLRAGDDADQIVAAGVEMLAAEAEHLAGHQHHFEAEDVVGGHAVFQAMHAAGILRHIAADGAGDLRRRIGRVVEAVVRDRRADGEIGDAGLDHRDAVGEVDLADAVELAHAEQHAVDRAAARRRTATCPPRAARRECRCRGNSAARPRPDRWSPAAPPPSAAACRRSARRIRKAASPARPRSRPRPARWPADRRRSAPRRASTASLASGITTDMGDPKWF